MQEYSPSIRLYVDHELDREMPIELGAEQAHYLCVVMRQKEGAVIELFNGRSGSFSARLEVAGRKSCTLRCVDRISHQHAPSDVWLLFAPVKRTRLDFMAQKATELGASVIWPVQTDFTQVSRVKDDRLLANAIEAAEQSGRLDIPEVRTYQKLREVIASLPQDRQLIFCDELMAGGAAPGPVLAAKGAQKAALLIGPEGGFSAAERQMLQNHPQTLSISLGPRILRADTAALSALSLYQAICGDWVEKPDNADNM